MREPIGTTRKGQLLLGIGGLVVGAGGGIGLDVKPGTFEPILRVALFGLGTLLRAHLHYDASQRIFFVILLPILGTLWAVLFGYAFVRETTRNRAIDIYLWRKAQVDQARQTTVISQDD